MGAERPLDDVAVDLVRPVQPLGVTRTIIGQRGRSVFPPSRAAAWIAAISSTTSSSTAAISWCITAGSSPTNRGA